MKLFTNLLTSKTNCIKTKKSQVEQMFFYILALFVIGTMLLLGIKYIGKIVKQVESVDLVEFKTSLQNDVDVLVTKYGSWKKAAYTVPKEVKKVCFFTIDAYKNGCPSLPDLDVVMCDAWQSGTQNVMTVPFVLESPINPSTVAPQTLKYLNIKYLISNIFTYHSMIFSTASCDSP